MALTTNLVSYYKLDGNSTDAVGANNGTDTSITYSAGNGKIVQGAGFNGTSSKIITGVTGLPTGAGARTINAWVYKTSTSVDVVAGNFGVTGTYFGLFINNLRIYAWGGGDTDTGLDVSLNAWHMITTTYDGTTVKVYLDAGTPYSASKTINTVYNASGFWIGVDNEGAGSAFFHGNEDEVGIWSRALTSTEVTSLYNGGAGLAYPFTPAATGNFFAFF